MSDSKINGVERQVCEVWSRVVGYLRPVSKWNKGKAEEFKDRKMFELNNDESSNEKEI